MIQALLLAAALALPCGDGSQVLAWDFWPTETEPVTTHFELERRVHGTEAWAPIGNTRPLNRPAYVDDDGKLQDDRVRVQWWPPLRGSHVPTEGVVYDYRVRAVAGTLRSAWSETFTDCPAGPTRCYRRDGVEEVCP
jgi:hypothetical protein